ncbi:D-amino acid dehydrogenase [Undibacterium sp. TJN19]|uniref:D-amino acid dehydrogenase n=1 Tax=Undibacterium sp. TJN19 TaxID=3413055 RepID=UPI003BF2AA66
MKICVVGAGVIGLTTAYALAKRGHNVLVIEAHSQVAQEASKANGAQLSYSYVAPLADAGVWQSLPGYLLKPDSPLRWRPRLDMQQWKWISSFMVACTRHASQKASVELLKLAFFSRDCLATMQKELAMDFDFRTAGKLVMLSSEKMLQTARRQIDFQQQYGCQQELLSAAACMQIEPALAVANRHWAGGVYTPSEQVGDCAAFCSQLAGFLAQDSNVSLAFNTRVTGAVMSGGRVHALRCAQGDIVADAFVLANGVDSTQTAATLDVSLSVYPLKGYSLTYETDDSKDLPTMSITDLAKKIVYARIGGRLRVAGKVEIVGNDKSLDARSWRGLADEAQQLFPVLAKHGDALVPWAGLRPATPTGIPIIGRSRLKNLYINAGHGALGWTLACGSAEKLAGEMDGEVPAINHI